MSFEGHEMIFPSYLFIHLFNSTKSFSTYSPSGVSAHFGFLKTKLKGFTNLRSI